jgi:hypothetical protein
MNRSIWRSLTFVLVVVLLLVTLLNRGQLGVAGPPSPSSQETHPAGPVESSAPVAPGTSSQGTEAQSLPAPGAQLDDLSLFPEAAVARFYHIPGSVLTPVASATALTYAPYGCVYATAGATYLLNAPLEIPHGSQIVLMRLYYDDTSATNNIIGWITRYNAYGTGFQDLVAVTSLGYSGHGTNYGDLDHIVDTYDWSYVLNVALGTASSGLQICGIRVMYYPPTGLTYLPNAQRNSQP